MKTTDCHCLASKYYFYNSKLKETHPKTPHTISNNKKTKTITIFDALAKINRKFSIDC